MSLNMELDTTERKSEVKGYWIIITATNTKFLLCVSHGIKNSLHIFTGSLQYILIIPIFFTQGLQKGLKCRSVLKACSHCWWRRKCTPFQCSCLEEPGVLLSMGSHRVGHDWGNLACMYALEKEMTTHSSILAWRIPWMEEPGGLPSRGSHRVGHNWSDLAAAAVFVGNPGPEIKRKIFRKRVQVGDIFMY